MRWYERVSDAFNAQEPKVNRAEVGRELGITGQAVTLKLQGVRPTNVDELKVFARYARMTVAEAVGDDAVVIELRDEMDLIELFRLMTPEQKVRFLATAKDMVAAMQQQGR